MSTGRGGSDKLSKNKRTETQKRRINEQPLRTIANRRRKQLKHFKEHPNHIKGVEKLRESLGIAR